jgi:hypothetical protein
MPRTNVVGTTTPTSSGAQRCAQAGEREHRIDSTAGTAATAARSSPLLSAYDGQRCIGFVCSRGKLGFEAFDSEERSLGCFKTAAAAANAAFDSASNEEAGVATRSAS